MKKFYRIEIYGFIGEGENKYFVHLYGMDHLTRIQMIKETDKLNLNGYVYQIGIHDFCIK
jgi:hypothetical protein